MSSAEENFSGLPAGLVLAHDPVAVSTSDAADVLQGMPIESITPLGAFLSHASPLAVYYFWWWFQARLEGWREAPPGWKIILMSWLTKKVKPTLFEMLRGICLISVVSKWFCTCLMLLSEEVVPPLTWNFISFAILDLRRGDRWWTWQEPCASWSLASGIGGNQTVLSLGRRYQERLRFH